MKPEPAPTGYPARPDAPPAPPGPCSIQWPTAEADPERPESAKAFGRGLLGPRVRRKCGHPPVGIAVAVARQKDSGGNGRLAPGLAEQERSLSPSNVKGESWVPPPPCTFNSPLHLPTSALLSPCPPPRPHPSLETVLVLFVLSPLVGYDCYLGFIASSVMHVEECVNFRKGEGSKGPLDLFP